MGGSRGASKKSSFSLGKEGLLPPEESARLSLFAPEALGGILSFHGEKQTP